MGDSGVFLVVDLEPRLQRTLRFPEVEKGEVNRTSQYSFDAAGSGTNFARTLRQLDVPVTLLAPLGGSGQQTYLNLLQEEGLEVEVVESGGELPTVYTILDGREGSVTELTEAVPFAPPEREESVRRRYRELLEGAHTVVVCGPGNLGYSDELVPWLLSVGREAGAKVVLDMPTGELQRAVEQRPQLLRSRTETFARGVGEGAKELADSGMVVLLSEESGTVRFAFPGGVSGSRNAMEAGGTKTSASASAFTAGFVVEWVESGDLEAALERGLVTASLAAGKLRPGAIR